MALGVGDRHVDLNALDNVFTFAGRTWDNDAQLYYNRARWYDPNTARFLSEDPIGFAAGDANLYRYVGNSTPNFTDPSGLGASSGVDPVADADAVAVAVADVDVDADADADADDPKKLIESAQRALEAIPTVFPDPVRFGRDTCERFCFSLEPSIKGLNHPGIKSVSVETFALFPNKDAPLRVQLTLTTGHAAVKVTLIDGSVYYYDNGFFGGDDQRFELRDIPSYAYPGIPSLGILESYEAFEAYWQQGYPPQSTVGDPDTGLELFGP